ncbi:CoA transferase [Salicibibacter cibarius]|uniref:CoA transferase n=1 Tax=Salicibibacter cibarius TaxID=2743000 RepID=A0A7T6Z6P0_9BACI|nr:CaiB/BaiF CoA-transferase family protein [Salicibibacter cibarius]QQK77796.1 CoA transferase [Salicibibacter cibarius]
MKANNLTIDNLNSTKKRYPLENIKIVDFSRVLSGPFCTMLLGDLGAEVIKIEKPDIGDENRNVRTYAGRTKEDEDYFYPMNRNKKSVEINLKNSSEKEKVYNLIKEADVIVENFTPGTMEKLQLDYSSVKEINEKIIYCSISGFGQQGLYKDRKAYDSIVQAITGVMAITGNPGESPLRSGLMFGDLTGSLYALSSILVSLYARERSGLGNHIDLSLADSLLSLYSTNAAEYLAVGNLPERGGSENPGRSPTGNYLCSDGKFIQIMGGSDILWPKFCEVVGILEFEYDDRFKTNEARILNRDELRKILTPIFLKHTSSYWVKKFNEHGVPSAPINTLADVLEDKHFIERNMELKLEHQKSGTIRAINNPFRFSSYNSYKLSPPPLLGQDNEELRK